MSSSDDGRFDDELEAQILALDPRHWAEARERVAALKEYLSRSSPTQGDAYDVAASMGISRSRFYELLRRWRDTGSVAVLIPHASGPERRADRLDDELVELINLVTFELFERDPKTNADTIWHEVGRRCADLRLHPPSRVTVRRRVARLIAEAGGRGQLRSQWEPSPSERIIQIDRAEIKLPVKDAEGRLGLAVVGLAVDAGTEEIAAHRVIFDEPFVQTAAALLLDLVKEGRLWSPASTSGNPVQFDCGRDPAWQVIAKALASAGIDARAFRSSKPGNGRRLRRIVGERIGAIPIRSRAVHDRAEERLRRHRGSRRDDPAALDLADVERALDHAISAHNKNLAVGEKRAQEPGLVRPEPNDSLLRELDRLASGKGLLAL